MIHFNPLPPYGGRLQESFQPIMDALFQSTPSVWRETRKRHTAKRTGCYFNPLPPYGGRRSGSTRDWFLNLFQSTPSVWRETPATSPLPTIPPHFNPLPPYGGRPSCRLLDNPQDIISIHSLRMEGDWDDPGTLLGMFYFNPLPPYGGRPISSEPTAATISFQSTPSVWRETICNSIWCGLIVISIHSLRMEGDARFIRTPICIENFNPLPPYGGRPGYVKFSASTAAISIHSLRMEGDAAAIDILGGDTFQSTPSVWRETLECLIKFSCSFIISIHSLRMEGDMSITLESFNSTYFNPLPPYGGRPRTFSFSLPRILISIHSLRMEGDSVTVHPCGKIRTFQSTPSVWRETAKLHRKAFFISPILVQSCKKGCKRLHSAPEKMIFFEKREKNSVRNLQHLSVRL